MPHSPTTPHTKTRSLPLPLYVRTWQERGWCRLETQVHELRLFEEPGGELMPGVPKIDLPRRPLIVPSGNYATTSDMMDNFYMLWQRKVREQSQQAQPQLTHAHARAHAHAPSTT